MSILDNLNENQKQAVLINDKPLLILAGAGAGKTKTIVHKIAYLIQEKGYRPYNILGLTFTKKAATEMKERVASLLNMPLSDLGLFLGTFHSFGALLLRKYGEHVGLNPNFTIYDTQDQLNLVKGIIKDGIVDSIIKPSVIYKKIANAKVSGITPENYFENSYQDRLDEIISKAYFEYAKRIKALNAVDFSDLLLYTVKLLRENPNIRQKLADKYRYVVVDEYQDTNKSQYNIVYSLTKEHRHIAVVGDEDQSIYSWRGATVENIDLFRRDFPDHEIIKLEQNYRSTQIILNVANKIIEKNPGRIGKNLWTANKKNIPVKVVEVETPANEAQFIVSTIEKYFLTKPYQIAVLYRVNSQSRILEEFLAKSGLPYKIVGNVGFYERMEIKDLIAYLKFIYNPKDEISLMRIINVPARRIGPKAINLLKQKALEAQLNFSEFIFFTSVATHTNIAERFISKSMQKQLQTIAQEPALKNYTHIFETFGKAIQYAYLEHTVTDIIKYIIEITDYYLWINKLSSSDEEYQARLENISELLRIASNQDKNNNITYKGIEGLGQFLEDIALIVAVKEQNEETPSQMPPVNLMTVHAAKGLEFDIVFIVGVNDGIFPHSRSKDDPIRLQEERRLFYVAVTRAKTHLYITYPRFMYTNNQLLDAQPSEYISDIPWEHVDFIEH